MTDRHRRDKTLWIASLIAVMLVLQTAFVMFLINVFEWWHG